MKDFSEVGLPYNRTNLLQANKHNYMLLIKQPVRIRYLIKQKRFSWGPKTLATKRSAVLFRFTLKNFEVKIKAFAQEKFCET